MAEAHGVRLTVVILTFNEALHIERCICSAKCVADDVLVVDSHSTDDTVLRAVRLGARVMQNAWTNYATQMNWALENGAVEGDWVMRLDADEFLDERLAETLREHLDAAPEEIGGFEVNRRVRFLGREIRHGGTAPMWVTRWWRNGWARCEARWMDEHMVLLKGRVERLPGGIIDDNRNPLTWWTQKHNGYASREAVDLLDLRYGLGVADERVEGLNRQARLKRGLKTGLYGRLPLGLRAWLYFGYRVILRLGFLDGSRGMIFHTLQGLWYRLLVDAKVAEVEQAMSQNGWSLEEAIREILGIEVRSQQFSQPQELGGD